MARIVPSDISRLSLSGAHPPEIRTLSWLKEELPEDYTVFHGVHWSRPYQGHTLYGEVDFVVVNRAGRVLVIEQKNGPLGEVQGGLFKDYGETHKDVAAQVLRGIGNIREKFAGLFGKKAGIEIDYLIYCPDHAIKTLIAAGIDRERVVDAPQREHLAERIRALLPPGSDRGDTHAERVDAFFRQTFEVVPAGGMVETWYGFCDRFLRSRGQPLDFSRLQSDPGFWDKAAQEVQALALSETPGGTGASIC